MKLRLLSILLLLVAGLTHRDDFLATRAGLVIREIGHYLLLHAGDSTSRVLPVKKQGQIRSNLASKISSPLCLLLVTIVHRSLFDNPASFILEAP